MKRILDALRKLASPARIVARWFQEYDHQVQSVRDTPAVGLYAQALASQIELNDGEFDHVVAEMYADAYLAGAKDALEQMPHGVAPEDLPVARAVAAVDWSAWTPGQTSPADLLHDGGFERLLQQSGVTLRGIDHTTRKRIGEVIERGVRAGETSHTIAAELSGILADPKRALLVATTEVNRAFSMASAEVYRRGGVRMFNLLTAVDPCPRCAEIAANNPHPMTDVADMSPIHPRCRCAISPVVVEDASEE